jgi:type II secretory pathway pseudopilin PulG
MADDRIERILRQKLRSAGRQIGEAKQAYRRARRASQANLPTDDEGRARIVCRRYAERRAVPVDDAGKPACYDAQSQDCRGCVEDVRAGDIETW